MEKVKIRHDWGFDTTVDLLKGLKYKILGDLFHGKG